MSVRRCFRFSKVLAVLFTVYVSERYLDNRPVFRQTKTVRLFFSSLADILASRGSRRRRRDAPHRAKSLFRSIEKQGFVLSFCKAVRVKYFMLCKSLRSAAKNDAPCRFLNALVQIPVVKYRKTKRTSEFACPFCLAEAKGVCTNTRFYCRQSFFSTAFVFFVLFLA